jgi:hypothetical protein
MRQGSAILPTRSSIPSLLVDVQYCRRLRRMHVNANAEASPASRIGTVAARCSRDAQLRVHYGCPTPTGETKHRETSNHGVSTVLPAAPARRFRSPVRRAGETPQRRLCRTLRLQPKSASPRFPPFTGPTLKVAFGSKEVQQLSLIPRDDARMAGSVWPSRRDLEKPTSHEREKRGD